MNMGLQQLLLKPVTERILLKVVEILTIWTAAVEGHPADPTVFIIGYPQPRGHSAPLSDLYLHCLRLTETEGHNNTCIKEN